MAVCIPKEYIEKIKRMIDSNPDEFAKAGSLTRLNEFKKIVGDNAQEVNLLYEKSLLLKRQEKALDNFIDKLDIDSPRKAKLKAQYEANKQRRQSIIDDNELLSISKDIYDRKHGVEIDPKNVQEIVRLKAEARDLDVKRQGTPDGSPQNRAYGRKVADMQEIIDATINPTQNMKFMETLGYYGKESLDRVKEKNSILGKAMEVISAGTDALTSSVYKSINASIDVSSLLRQGFKTLSRNPEIWVKNMKNAFKPFGKLTSKQQQDLVFREFKADIVSRKLYQEAKDAGLGIGVVEEFFPTPVAEKVPVLGNFFKSSDISFTMFSQGVRMDTFEKLYKNYIKQHGIAPDKETAEGFATLVNSISGRGNLGELEKNAKLLNKVFFSAKFVKAQTDFFNPKFYADLPPAARNEALKSAATTFAAIGTLVGAASMFTEVGTDITNSKFLKAKIPGTDRWVDLSAGLGSYMVLAAKTAKALNKDTPPKYGEKTGLDTIYDFATNKLSPAFSQIAQHLRGKDYDGEVPTVRKSIRNVFTPITPENIYDAFSDEETAQALISSIAEIFGMSVTDYSKFK